MKYLPYENFYIITLLSPGEVKEQLKKVIEPDTGFSFKKLFYRSSDYYFSGDVVNNIFEI
jgi:hypothetical protein